MSLVSDFVKSCHAQAAPMIGQEAVVIGSDSILCTIAEISDGKDFSEGGFERSRSLSAVCLTSALPIASILKKAATARGENFRVEGISKGGTFTTLTLEQVTKA